MLWRRQSKLLFEILNSIFMEINILRFMYPFVQHEIDNTQIIIFKRFSCPLQTDYLELFFMVTLLDALKPLNMSMFLVFFIYFSDKYRFYFKINQNTAMLNYFSPDISILVVALQIRQLMICVFPCFGSRIGSMLRVNATWEFSIFNHQTNTHPPSLALSAVWSSYVRN